MNYNRTEKRESQLIANVRNVTIILAAAAVGYSALFGPINANHNGEKSSKTPLQQSVEVSISQQDKKSGDGTTLPAKMMIIDGRLIAGTDESSTIYKNHLKQRISDLESAGMVESVNRQTSTQAGNHADQASTPTYPPAAPIRSSVTPDASGQTFHKAPFVDEVAAASIDRKKAAMIDSGITGTVKIGYHVDGTKMSENEKQEQIRHTLSNIPDEWTINYTAPNEKVRLYVFTDPTCPFCRKFHENMDQILGAGISVHYLLFPRDLASATGGQLSPTAMNMKNIWCSVNQRQAFDDAFAGYRVPEADCDALPEGLKRGPAPIPDHFIAGDMFDVQYTPTFFGSNGTSGYGFSDVNALIRAVLP